MTSISAAILVWMCACALSEMTGCPEWAFDCLAVVLFLASLMPSCLIDNQQQKEL